MPALALALAATLQLPTAAAPAPVPARSIPARPLPATASAGPPAPVGGKGAGALDVSRYPPDQQARYRLVVQKCSRCHGMERSLNERFGPDEWRRYLKRMVRLSGSGVSAEQAVEIERFLVYFSAHLGR
jgi:hypothetical protein